MRATHSDVLQAPHLSDDVTARLQAAGVELVVLASVTLFEQVKAREILDRLERRLPGVRIVVACSGDVCADTSIREDEVFVAKEFFGGPHPGPGAVAGGGDL